MTTLTPMLRSAYASYRERAAHGYAEDNVTSGRWPAEGALQRSYNSFDELLPQGTDTSDNYVFDIRDEATETTVGILWFAVVTKHGIKSAFVYDIEIWPEYRRRGHARAALFALESLAAGLGLTHIGLHVFRHNVGAQALYQSVGYEVTSVNMLKRIGDSGTANSQ